MFPKIRFKEFINIGEWESKKIKDILFFEQPTKYLVNSANYESNGIVPVLTAGKSFILGFTNEEFGVNKKESIIFDDFTLDYRFINFPYKIKSSAIKILYPYEGYNLFFVFNSLFKLKLSPLGHQRHYISFVQELYLNTTTLKEQQKIANFFSLLDKQIELWERKLELYKLILNFVNNKILNTNVKESQYQLKDLCCINKSEPINKNNYHLYKKMILKLNNEGVVLTNENPKITSKGRPYFVRNANELLIGKQNIHNRSFFILPKNLGRNYVTSNALVSFVAKEKINLHQIFYIMKSNKWIHYVDSLNSATGQKEYSDNQIMNLKIPYSENNENIINTLLKIDSNILNIKEKIKLLKNQKQYYLNKMFC